MDDIFATSRQAQKASRETPHLIWWLQGQECQNFGDYLTEFLWNNLAEEMRVPGDGYRLIGSAIDEAIIDRDLRGLGKWERGRIVFWCCGLRDGKPLGPEFVARSVFCGVRGPLTRDALNLPPSTPFGDPALLLPLLHEPIPHERTNGKTVCLPHFLDENSEGRLLEMTGADVIVRPSVANSPEALTEILDEISSADFVLAGSLHAAIAACAYGVPFCYFDSGYVDLPFKWRDFSASVNIGTSFVDNVAEGRKIYETTIRPRLHRPLLFPILAAAPFRVRPPQLLRAALHDAERLSAREQIDVDAFSRFIDLAGSDIAAVGSESHRRAIADAMQALTLAETQAAERERERDAAKEALALAETQSAEREREREAAKEALTLAEAQMAERERERDLARKALALAGAQAAGRGRERDAAAQAMARAETEAAERGRERDAAALALARAETEAAERGREWDAAKAALALAEAHAAERERKREAAYADALSRLTDERDLLTRELTKAFRRPWRPIKHLIGHNLLAVLAAASSPFAKEMSARFTRSADKRSPRRFEKFLDATPISLPPVVDFRPQLAPEKKYDPIELPPVTSLEVSVIIPVPLPAVVDIQSQLAPEKKYDPIEFPAVTSPEVSVVIPVYKGLSDIEACLRSMSDSRSTEPTFEVVLVDDCPAEPVLDGIPDSEGLVKIANEKNLGFLLSCNAGAAVARGRYLCFLNSDTLVRPGWLRALVEAIQETPRAAIVGPMLLNVDGTIQDAGWRILGSGWGFPLGRGGSPNDGAYTYRRVVDCVTGACFLVPKTIFERLGGLDPLYAPAFYEEFDLAFRARAIGHRTIYEPRSRVTHVGSASYGAEQRDELSAFNHAKFVRRFADRLRKHPHDTSDEFSLRHGVDEGPVILVVDDGVPRPDRHAGGVTMSIYLGLLASAGWRVVFCPMDGAAEGPAAERLEAQGIELIRAPQTVESWLSNHGKHVRAAWVARPQVAMRCLPAARTLASANITYYTHDLHFMRMRQQAQLHDDPELLIAAEIMRAQEIEVFRAADVVIAPSELECQLIADLVPGKPTFVLPPYFFEARELRTRDQEYFASRSDVLFVGGFPHLPNVDAALFIAKEVMPLVWREERAARLVLVGYAPPEEVQALANDQILVTGQVPDVEPYMNEARVFLAALRFGAGVKGKVVQALQFGVPVVTTAVGADGVGIESGHNGIVAEGPAALAEAVISLFRDPARCAAFSAAGVELVKRKYSRAAARSAIESIFQTTRCAVCGSAEVARDPAISNLREAFVCRNCFALGRTEALARVLVSRLAQNSESSLAELVRTCCRFRIHEFGFVGGIAETLRGWKNYSMSEYFDDVPIGMAGPNGIRCEDLARLTYPDDSCDFSISQDVLEHVPNPLLAFAEIARVLRPGGSHIFTVPRNAALPKSVSRARLGPKGIEHLLPAKYHGDPIRAQGALVFTDFGADLKALVEVVGMQLIEHSIPSLGAASDQLVSVFEAVKVKLDGQACNCETSSLALPA